MTASAGAEVLRQGGNAADAAVAAMLASFVAEPLLTGMGSGGYMLVGGDGRACELLDFSVESPGRGSPGDDGGSSGDRAPLEAVEVSFGDAKQVFHVGASSAAVYGTPAGVAAANDRYGSLPLEQLAAPAVGLARAGVEVTPEQAYLFEILAPIIASTAEASAVLLPRGRPPRAGEWLALPELGDGIERLASDGPDAFYTGSVAHAVCAWVGARGGLLSRADLAAYRVAIRTPLQVGFRGRTVMTNPPPSAGGVLLGYALSLLECRSHAASAIDLVRAMEAAQAERTPEFMAGLGDAGFADSFLATRLGSTTHISVLDSDGMACSVTCTNGEGSGVVVPGTGLHLNNMLGEEDLSPLGFFSHAPGQRLPSMMAPTLVLGSDGRPELVLGSAGSNRIRSALLQVIVNAIDAGLDVRDAVGAARLHFERGVVYAEPGIDLRALEASAAHTVARFRALNLFFGGVQAVRRDPRSGALSGAGDPRRGGVAIVAV